MSADLLDRLLPVGTLVLGAFLTAAQGRSSHRREARREAADMLAEHRRHIWNHDENGWIDLQVYLGRLEARLRGAGVPSTVALWVVFAAGDFWKAVRDSGDPDVGLYVDDPQIHGQLIEATEAASLWLHPSLRPLTRRKAKQDARAWIANNDP